MNVVSIRVYLKKLVKNYSHYLFIFCKLLCFCFAFYLALHPSRAPEIWGLYSINKFTVITILFISGMLLNLILKFLVKKKFLILTLISDKKDLDVFKIFFFILFVSYIFSVNHSLGVGTDFAEQLKSAQQWKNNEVNLLNNIITRQINDINQSSTIWSARPPAAMIYYIPFLYLPIPLGTSLMFANLILCIIIGYCWIRLAQSLTRIVKVHLIFSITLGISLTSTLYYLGNLQTLVSAYSSILTLTMFKVIKYERLKQFSIKNILKISFIFLLLGLIVWIKISAVIYTGTIAFIFSLVWLLKKDGSGISIDYSIRRIFSLSLFVTIFLLPIILLNYLNKEMGLDTNAVYNQNYNEVEIIKLHWGDFYSETTKFPIIILSLISSWSTFGPFTYFQALLSNALTFIGVGDDFFRNLQLNTKLMWKSIVGAICSILMFIGFINLKFNNKKTYLLIISLLFVPFFIFMLLSNKYGYNFLMSGTYADQYSPVLILLCVFLVIKLNSARLINKLIKILIIVPCLSLYTFSSAKCTLEHIINSFNYDLQSPNNLYHPFYGNNAGSVIEKVKSIRKSINIPIIYLSDSSIYEIAIFYDGPFCRFCSTEHVYNPKSSIFNKHQPPIIMIIDSRLDFNKMHAEFINNKTLNPKIILNEKGSAYVLLFNSS